MPFIRPCSDLKNNYNEISKICHETNEPVYITRNGANGLVALSHEAYENLKKNNQETKEERIVPSTKEIETKYHFNEGHKITFSHKTHKDLQNIHFYIEYI